MTAQPLQIVPALPAPTRARAGPAVQRQRRRPRRGLRPAPRGQDRSNAERAARNTRGPVVGVHAGCRRGLPAIAGTRRWPTTTPGVQHRRGGHRRHGRARPRQHRARGGAAGHGGQGGAVQAVRRRRRRARSAWTCRTSTGSSRPWPGSRPAFGGINLEDISAPRCFEIERRLQELLDIPVFHDDQHGTAIVVLAALPTPRGHGRNSATCGSSSAARVRRASP